MNSANAYQVIVSPQAYSDLDQIFDYIAARSPQGTVNVIDQLWMAAVGLGRFPNRHRIYQKAGGARLETRVMPVGNYLLYYRVIESQKLVRILTIRHGSRRQPRKL